MAMTTRIIPLPCRHLSRYVRSRFGQRGYHACVQPHVSPTPPEKHMSFLTNRKFSNQHDVFLAQHLQERTLLKLSGQDVSVFLQGLITNDMELMNQSGDQCARSIYTLFLNVQGRVLYDMMLYNLADKNTNKEEQNLLLECSKEIASDLLKLIKRYKIRKKISLDTVGDEYAVWAVFPESGMTEEPVPKITDPSKIICWESDPRLKQLGHRLILPADVHVKSVMSNVEEVGEPRLYREHRYRLGVPEGPGELPVGGCLPLESNAAFLNGLSFNKGCYIGQELTARTHHTGLTRKRIMPLALEKDIQADSVTIHNSSDKKCGALRGSSGQHGIGLMRIPDTVGKGPLTLKDAEGSVLTSAKAIIPSWWQTDTDQILKQVMTDYPSEFSTSDK